MRRLQLAQRKKEELLAKIREKNEFKIGKSEQWITKKKKYWRNFRESSGLNSDDEEEIRRELVAKIPERIQRKTPDTEKLSLA